MLICCSCATFQVKSPSRDEMRSKVYKRVSLETLLSDKAIYHGRYVQTEGIFNCRFEELAVFYENTYTFDDTVVKWREFCGLWLEFNYDEPSYRGCVDSLRQKYVSVKGFFDTTKKGHVGGCYLASLTNAFDFQIVNSGNDSNQ
jgi:hypothetical protein